MKIKLMVYFLSLGIIHFSYAMNKTEEEMFQDNLSKLEKPVQVFVNDFKMWSKREQDKVKLFSNSGGASFAIQRKPLASDKFNGNIERWLEKHVTENQTIPFFLAIDYLKKQKKE